MIIIIFSPAYVLTVDEVPLEYIHVEDVQVKTVGLNAVEFAITSNLGLSLIEVGLGSGLTVELLDL